MQAVYPEVLNIDAIFDNYGSYSENGGALQKLMNSLPRGYLALVGV